MLNRQMIGFHLLIFSGCMSALMCSSVIGEQPNAASDDDSIVDSNNQQGTKAKPSDRKTANTSTRTGKQPASGRPVNRSTSPTQERALLKFVSEHQPELIELLDFMRKDKRKDRYEQAIREISRTKTRLEGLQKRDQEHYAVELALWKLDSQLRLQAAKIGALKKDSEREKAQKRLEELVAKQQAKSLEKLKLQRRRAKAQLERLDKQIAERENNAEALTAKSIKIWQNRIAKPPKQNKTKKNTDSK